MSLDQNKTTARRFVEEIFGKGNLDLITQLVDSKFVSHDPAMPEPTKGHDGLRDFVTQVRSAFSNFTVKAEDVFGEGEKVCVRWTCTGKHTGEFLGASPTGKSITVTGTDIYRFSNGKIVENFSQWDALGVFQKMGVIPELESVA